MHNPSDTLNSCTAIACTFRLGAKRPPHRSLERRCISPVSPKITQAHCLPQPAHLLRQALCNRACVQFKPRGRLLGAAKLCTASRRVRAAHNAESRVHRHAERQQREQRGQVAGSSGGRAASCPVQRWRAACGAAFVATPPGHGASSAGIGVSCVGSLAPAASCSRSKLRPWQRSQVGVQGVKSRAPLCLR